MIFRVFFGFEEPDEAILQKICGILLTNAFELLFNGQRIRGLYASASLFAHSCSPNTKHVFDHQHNIIFRATRDIAKGQPIFTTYSQVFWDTLSRRHQLKV